MKFHNFITIITVVKKNIFLCHIISTTTMLYKIIVEKMFPLRINLINRLISELPYDIDKHGIRRRFRCLFVSVTCITYLTITFDHVNAKFTKHYLLSKVDFDLG